MALIGAVLTFAAPPARAADSAVVLLYSRFGDDQPSGIGIDLALFDAHIAELTNGRYSVLPLPEIVAQIKQGKPLPDRAIAITIEEAYRTVYEDAWPRLQRAQLPFTLFVTPDGIDRRSPEFMSWEQVRELQRSGVTIGSHTRRSVRMANSTVEQSAEEVRQAIARIEAEIGQRPVLFAYPIGEWSLAARQAVADAGFIAAFGQQSGVVHASQDIFVLPRFSLSQRFGDLDRLRTAANALPLPVSDVLPRDGRLDQNPPAFGFTVGADIGSLDRLRCFASHQSGTTRVERLGERRFEVRLNRPFPPGRGRINCTVPGPDDRFRWLGAQFYVPR